MFPPRFYRQRHQPAGHDPVSIPASWCWKMPLPGWSAGTRFQLLCLHQGWASSRQKWRTQGNEY